MYRDLLKNEDIIFIKEKENVKSCWHIYPIQLKNRKKVFEFLRKKGILVQVHYVPLHFQPFYQKKFNYKVGDFPVVEEYYKKALTLPLYPKMKNTDVETVVKTLKQIL